MCRGILISGPPERGTSAQVSSQIRCFGYAVSVSTTAFNPAPLCLWAALLGENQQRESVRYDRGPWPRIFRCGCGSRTKFRRDRPVTARRECHSGARIEPGRVDAIPNRYLGNGFSRGVINDHHLLVVATDEQPLVLGINGQAAGRFAALNGPIVEHLEGLGVKLDEQSFVFIVHEDVPLTIGGRRFGLAAKRNGARHLAGLRVYARSVLAAGIEDEDALRRGIVEIAVGALSCRQRNLLDHLESF